MLNSDTHPPPSLSVRSTITMSDVGLPTGVRLFINSTHPLVPSFHLKCHLLQILRISLDTHKRSQILHPKHCPHPNPTRLNTKWMLDVILPLEYTRNIQLSSVRLPVAATALTHQRCVAMLCQWMIWPPSLMVNKKELMHLPSFE